MKKSTKLIIAVLVIQVIIFAVVVHHEWQKPNAGNSVLDGLGVVIAVVATPLLFAAVFGLFALFEFLAKAFGRGPEEYDLPVAESPEPAHVTSRPETQRTENRSLFGKLFGATLLFWPLLFVIVFGLGWLNKHRSEISEREAEQEQVEKAKAIAQCLAENQSYFKIKPTNEPSSGLVLVDPDGKEYDFSIGISSGNRQFKQVPVVFFRVRDVPQFDACDTLAWANYGLRLTKPFLADSIYQNIRESVEKKQTSFSCFSDYGQFSLYYSLYKAYSPFEINMRSDRSMNTKNMYLQFSFNNCKSQKCAPEKYY